MRLSSIINTGFLVSFVTELFKFIPELAKTDTRKRIVAFSVALLASFFMSDTETVSDLISFLLGVLVVAYGTYKTIIKQITESLGLAEKLKET